MNPILKLIDHGQSYWLDNLTRQMIEEGELARRVTDMGLRGVTSNPAIFHKGIAHSNAYDAQIEAAVKAGRNVNEVYDEITTTDVRNACDVLRPVFEESGGADGFISLEVSPLLARDTAGSIAAAKRLAAMVDRPNLLIKIPGTREGVPAVEELLYEGISVNVTLLFGIPAYEAVHEAYLRAMERRLEASRPLHTIASVASFFLSRIDTLADQLLGHRIAGADGPDPQRLRGEVALASAKLAYQSFTSVLGGDRWRRLADQGARPQRLLWASTSTKNPDYSDVMYVEPLIGPHTVNTMPEQTITAFADHGHVSDTVEQGVDEARQVMADLDRLGIDIDLITAQLENEGVQKFIDPFDDLLAGLEQKCLSFENRQAAGPLHGMADRLRIDSIRMTTEAGSGHPTSCLSCAEIMAALFFHEMRWDPTEPHARDVDSFVLSKGHAAPILWAALSEAGALHEDLLTLRRFDSSLEGHPTPNNPWIKVATGSLGQGLSAANGIALANRLDNIPGRVYCLLGDGECSEGSVWEAAQFAALHHIDNLVAIVDVNGLGQSAPTPYTHHTEVFAARFEAFGWKAIQVDGHDLDALLDALEQARSGGPTAIIARTEKGKGVSFVEGEEGWHGKALSEEEMARALAEIGEPPVPIKVEPRHVGGRPTEVPETPAPIPVSYEAGAAVATRTAYGSALKKLGAVLPQVVAIDGDVQNSTRAEYFHEAYPERFFEGYIAEQNMAGTGLGLAACGKIPFVATFAAFLSRAFDFIRMAGHSRPPHLVFCGSHAGISIGQDGPSQMGLEDIAMFRAVSGTTVLYPSDAVSAERLTEAATRTEGVVYLRTTRPKTPVLYSADEEFPVGGSKVLRQSDHDAYTLIAAGITVHEALAAYESLKAQGVTVRVIDAYSVKPIDTETLTKAARETEALIVVEDHWPEGGLGDAIAAGLAGLARIHHLAVNGEPRSGKPEELMEHYGISRGAIERVVLGLGR